MSILKNNLESFAISVAEHLNYLRSLIGDSVSSEVHNNAVNQINQTIDNFRNSITDMESKTQKITGLKFVANQGENKIYLKNSSDEEITSVDVGFLNNEGTKFVYNDSDKSIDLKNDKDEKLSSIPLSSFVSGLPINLGFNSATPYVLELKSTEGTVLSSVEISKDNIKNLSNLLSNVATIYSQDGTITGEREITFDEKIKFKKDNQNVSIDKGEIKLEKLTTDKYSVSKNADILKALSLDSGNKSGIELGNVDLDSLIIKAKNTNIQLPAATNPTRMVAIDEQGNLSYVAGGIQHLRAGDGILIEGDIIKLAPHDMISLSFNW